MPDNVQRPKRFPPGEPVYVMMKWPQSEPNAAGEHFAILGIATEVAEDGKTALIPDADGETIRVPLREGLAFGSPEESLVAVQALMQCYLSGDDPFGRADTHLLRVVKGQLEHLKRQQHRPLDYDNLLRLSAILRQLLFDNSGLLQSAWRAFGYANAIRIQTTFIDDLLDSDYLKGRTAFIAANGAVVGSSWLGPLSQCEPQLTARLGKDLALFGDDSYEPTTLRLSDYLGSTCIYLDGIKVSRRHLVKYVANKLGGTHYDTARDEKDASELASYKALDDLFDFYSVTPKGARSTPVFEGKLHALHIALLAVWRDITESRDVNLLLKKLGQAFS